MFVWRIRTQVIVTLVYRTLKESTIEAILDWLPNVQESYYIIGSLFGSVPFPGIVRGFQSVIGREARVQILERIGGVVACIGSGKDVERLLTLGAGLA